MDSDDDGFVDSKELVTDDGLHRPLSLPLGPAAPPSSLAFSLHPPPAAVAVDQPVNHSASYGDGEGASDVDFPTLGVLRVVDWLETQPVPPAAALNDLPAKYGFGEHLPALGFSHGARGADISYQQSVAAAEANVFARAGKWHSRDFTEAQLVVMESLFSLCQSPDSEVLRRLAQHIDEPLSRVSNWFKRRRERARKEMPMMPDELIQFADIASRQRPAMMVQQPAAAFAVPDMGFRPICPAPSASFNSWREPIRVTKTRSSRRETTAEEYPALPFPAPPDAAPFPALPVYSQGAALPPQLIHDMATVCSLGSTAPRPSSAITGPACGAGAYAFTGGMSEGGSGGRARAITGRKGRATRSGARGNTSCTGWGTAGTGGGTELYPVPFFPPPCAPAPFHTLSVYGQAPALPPQLLLGVSSVTMLANSTPSASGVSSLGSSGRAIIGSRSADAAGGAVPKTKRGASGGFRITSGGASPLTGMASGGAVGGMKYGDTGGAVSGGASNSDVSGVNAPREPGHPRAVLVAKRRAASIRQREQDAKAAI